MKERQRLWGFGAVSVAVRAAALASIVVCACALATFGAVRVDVLSPPKDAAPGEVVAHVFSVTHDGPAAATFSLEAGAPAGWAILGVPAEITVGPGEEGLVSMTLTVPADAAAGMAVVSLRATSILDPADDASAGVATRIAAVNQIELTAPAGRSLSPGTSTSYSVRVTNRGNAQDVVAVIVASSRGYAAEASAPSLELAPQESRDLVVRLILPPSAARGRDVLSVHVRSTLYPGVEDEIAIFTTILPPAPNAVGGSLYEVLPARLTFGVERNETTDAFDSHASVFVTGLVFDGTFTASAAALHPFGPDPVDVTAYTLAYRTDRTSFAVGTVSQSITDLHSIACDGGSMTLDAGLFDAALIAGGGDGETRFGGRLAFGPEEVRAGFAYTDRRTLAARSAAWTGFARAEPLDGWTLRAEGGRGTSDGKTGRAALFGTSIDTEVYFLSAAAFSVDTYFPGPRQDQAGIEASQRLRLETFSFGLSVGHVWSNVIRAPLVPTLVTDTLGVNVAATPWEDGPTIQGTISFERKHQSDGVPRDDVDVLLAYHVADSRNPFPYAFSGRVADRLDLVAGTRERTVTHTQEVGLSIDELLVSLRLSEEQTVDLAHGIVLATGGSASLVVRPAGIPHEASIDFRSSAGGRLDLKAAFVLRPARDLSVSVGGFAEWERGDPAAARFGWSLDVDVTLGIPLPFLVTRGRISGRVFVDRNGNGALDAGEVPAAGAVVFVGAAEVSTDSAGVYRFRPLPPGTHSLDVRELPPDAASAGPISVAIAPGDEVVIDIPLAPRIAIRGTVFDDADQDGDRQPGEPGIADVGVVFVDNTGASFRTTSDARGDFVLANARPGSYIVSVDALTLPDGFSFTTPPSASADAGADVVILFGGFVPLRPIATAPQPPAPDTVTDAAGSRDTETVDVVVEATPAAQPPTGTPTAPPSGAARPPVADFAYAPVLPTAGLPATFDAAASVDFDGGIVRYAWDFNADGVPDAEGARAEWIFPSAGAHDVALTVTDATGLTDSAVYTVDVASPAVAPPLPEAAPAPADLEARFVYAPTAPRAGAVVRFDASASAESGGSDLVFAWDFNADGTADSRSSVAEWVFQEPGTYPVMLAVDAPDGRSAVTTQTVAVVSSQSGVSGSQPPIAVLEVAPERPKANAPVLFSSTSSVDFDGLVVAVAWDFTSDGLIDSTQAATTTTYAEPGTFVVTLTVFDDAGNSDTVTATLTVE